MVIDTVDQFRNFSASKSLPLSLRTRHIAACTYSEGVVEVLVLVPEVMSGFPRVIQPARLCRNQPLDFVTQSDQAGEPVGQIAISTVALPSVRGSEFLLSRAHELKTMSSSLFSLSSVIAMKRYA